MPDVVGLDFVRDRGTGPYEVHSAAKHIEELRNFIKAHSPQDPSDPSNPRVLRDFIHNFLALLRFARHYLAGDEPLDILFVDLVVAGCLHRTKFQERKRRAVPANALLWN